jgi:16S rRNA (uracil1498-N3)-methyltransferase
MAHYVRDVLRYGPGAPLLVTDAAGAKFRARIGRCDRRVVSIVAEEVLPPDSGGLQLHLFPALLKGERFEWMLQKATELGASGFTPVVTERTIARPRADRLEARLHRWRKIAQEASRQCGRGQVPAVNPPMDFAAALGTWQNTGLGGIIPHEKLGQEHAAGVGKALRECPERGLGVFIGPEGGFTPQEFSAACAAGLTPVSLGPRILRAETAAIALCAMALYEWELGSSPTVSQE